jgi:hypothetical protein
MVQAFFQKGIVCFACGPCAQFLSEISQQLVTNLGPVVEFGYSATKKLGDYTRKHAILHKRGSRLLSDAVAFPQFGKHGI